MASQFDNRNDFLTRYNYERERRRRATQVTPQIMSAHQQVGTPNVNPFQDNFTPNTNTLSMQEIAGQVAPQIDQPLPERIARGAMNVPIGMAAMAEQATSDPAGFAKGTGEYLATWARRLNPNPTDPTTLQARAEWGQQFVTDPVGSTLDAAGVAGTALGLPALGGKIKGFKSIKEARAAINDIGKPKVDVPEVVQEPIRSETSKVEQPTSAAEVVMKAEPTTKKSFEMTMYHGTDAENIDAFDVSDRQYGAGNKNPLGDNIGAFFTTKKESAQGFGKNVVSRKIQLGNPKVFNSYDDFKTFLRENTSPNDGLEWKVSEYQDAPGEYFSEGRNADGVIADSKNFSDRADAERYVESKTKNNTKQGGQQLLKDMGHDGVVIKNPFIDTKTKEVWAIAFDNKSIVDGVPTDIPAKQPTTATEVVAKAKPNLVTGNVKQLTPDELTAAQEKLREKFKPMDEAIATSTPPVEKAYTDPLTPHMVEAAKQSGDELRRRVSNVKYAPMQAGAKHESIQFDIDGTSYTAELKGRNKNLTVGMSDESDRGIAARAFLDGDAVPVKSTPDAAVRPAQSTKPTATAKAKEPWEVRPREWIKGVKAGDNEWSAMVDKHFSAIDEFNRDIDTPGTYAEKTMRGSHLAADPFQRNHPEHAYASVRSGLASDALIPRLSSHKAMVEQAIKDGKPVPPEVLADYPDLAAKYGKQGGGSVELGAFGTPSVLHSTMGAVGRVAEKSMIPIQYIAKKIDGFMEKRGLANPLGTPEIVLKDTGIVEAFRDATAKEHAFVAEQSAKLREILGGRIKSEKYLAQMFRHLDNPEAILNPTEKALRGWFDDMLNTVNEFRIKRGEDPINYTEGYIPHIFKKSKELLDADQSIALPRKAQNRFANERVGAEGYEKDLIQALELYTKATARDMYVNDALHASIPAIEAMSKKGSKILRREVITTPDGASKTINFYNLNNADMWSKRGYAEAFVRAQLGLPTQGQRFFKQLGINPRTSQRVSNMATGLVYRNLLGMAIDTGVKNLSQVTHTIAENGMAPTLRGIGKFLTPEGIKTARAEHLLKEFDAFLLSEDMPAATRAKIFKQFDENVINGAMRFSEFVNRGIAYHTALDDAIKAGKSITDAHEIALKAVRGTQFEYNKLGTSPFMRGPLTRPAAQFMTFPVKTSEMLYRWANEGNTGRGKLLRYFATVGGLVYAGKEAGVELGNIFFDPTKTVDKDSKSGIELPLSGNKVKLDPSRLGTTGFAPQGAVPAVTKPYKYINDLMTKDRTAGQRVGQAAREFLPGGRFVGKVVDVATGSEYRDDRGRLIRKDTPKDAFLRLFGGRSSNQELMNNKKTDIRDVEQEYYETRRKIIDTQLNGEVEEAKRMIADFSEKYPYLASRLRRSLRQGRKDERRKKQMSSDERFMESSIRKQIEHNL